MALSTQAARSKDKQTARAGVELQHRHFSFIAATIKDAANAGLTANQIAELSLHFATACAVTNPHFDRDRFLKACGTFR